MSFNQPEDENPENIRVILPNRKKGEMFGLVEKLSGASRLSVMCEDGFTRNSRIPGKMKKRMWIREGDLVIVKPWEFQKDRADYLRIKGPAFITININSPVRIIPLNKI